MNVSSSSIRSDALAVEAVRVMEQKKISALPVKTESGVLVGAINMRQIIQAGVV